MSGGSHAYLCCRDNLDEFEDYQEELTQMVSDIEELVPNSAAYRDTLEVLSFLRMAESMLEEFYYRHDEPEYQEAEEKFSKLVTRDLQQVWHDVEWYHSGDYGPEQAVHSIKEYEVKHGKRR